METKHLIMELVGVQGNAGAIIAPDIFKERDRIVKNLLALQPSQENFVSDATIDVREAKALLQSVEGARKSIKAPVLDLGKRIDFVADDFSQVMRIQVDRLERQIGDVVRKEKEAKEKLERELQEKREAEAAEASRKEIELQAKLAKTKGVVARENLQSEIEQLRTDAVESVAESTQQLSTIRHTPILEGGSQVRGTWVAEVVDISMAFRSRPDLFEIVFSKTKFNAAMKLDEKRTLVTPGLKVTREVKASIR